VDDEGAEYDARDEKGEIYFAIKFSRPRTTSEGDV
jgi:hypothetical protein